MALLKISYFRGKQNSRKIKSLLKKITLIAGEIRVSAGSGNTETLNIFFPNVAKNMKNLDFKNTNTESSEDNISHLSLKAIFKWHK